MEKLKYERPFLKKMSAGMMDKSGAQSEFTPVTEIDGVPVKQIISEYGSPVFVLSEQKMRHNYQSAVRAFNTRYPKVQFAWSYKTHYNNAVCRIFHQEGSWAEVVSGFEYKKALNSALDYNNPETIVALVEELIQRGALEISLANRSEDELESVLKFVQWKITDYRYQHVCVQILRFVLDMYQGILGTGHSP